jgi:hypothetical protein
VPIVGLRIWEFQEERRFLGRSEREEARAFVRELVEGVTPPPVEMPLMTPLLLCPDCGELGAHLAELTANGAHWRRECVHCEYRWLEP